MSQPKWTEERTNTLVNFVGDESPISRETVAEAAEQLEASERSVSSKLRKMGYEVEKAGKTQPKFNEAQEAKLRTFLEDNSGEYTYAEIAEAFQGGHFSAKEVQGKVLSMQLTGLVKAAPKPETVKTYSDAEEATFIRLAKAGKFIEEIAEKLDRQVNSVRGKALSLLRSQAIDSIPKQRDTVGASRVDALEALGDISEMTVVEIAEAIEKTPRGVKTMLTRRGLTVADYDGAAKAQKAAG